MVIGGAVIGLVAGGLARYPIRAWPRDVDPSEPPAGSVEVAAAALFGLIVLRWGLDPFLPALLVFVWALLVATVIDLTHQIIPNRLTLRVPLVLLPLVVLAAWVDGAFEALIRALISAVVVPLIMLVLSEGFRLVRGNVGMGMGDIKLAVSIGLIVGYLGVFELVVSAYAAMGLAVVVAIVLLCTKRAKLASKIPFGPYLAAGALVPLLGRDFVMDPVRAALLG